LLEQVKGESQEGRERLRAQMKNLQEKEWHTPTSHLVGFGCPWRWMPPE
jgi:hypothetical protein